MQPQVETGHWGENLARERPQNRKKETAFIKQPTSKLRASEPADVVGGAQRLGPGLGVL